MNIWNLARFFSLALLIGAGCGNADTPPAKTPPAQSASAESTKTNAIAATAPPNTSPNKAQPKLQTLKLWVGAEQVVAEIASTQKEIETGMMYRTSMEEHEGMLFIFGAPHKASFWMRNTLLPLSCAYIDSEGVVLETHPMKPLDESPIPAGSDRVQYVLEVKQGWFDRHNIKPGAILRTERGSLSETFFRR